MTHRGPDGEGYWADDLFQSGHRRLSIQDLSQVAAQPMVDEFSNTVLIYNGEIYNFLELRRTLETLGHVFLTRSDTEVLLRGWLQWRENVTHYLNGMWAFVIWEPHSKTLFASRDRFGVKPLYFALKNDRLLLASEPKALIALEPGLAQVNERALRDLVIRSRGVLGSQSFYAEIHSLPAAHSMTLKLHNGHPVKRPKFERYWRYPPPNNSPITSENAAAQFRSMFDDAVKIRMRSDVPIGVTLSGGIDSSAVLAGTHSMATNRLRCYTSVFSSTQRGEESWALKAAAVRGYELQSVNASGADWLSTLKAIVHHMDGPNQTSSVYALWKLSEQAKKDGVSVLLEGQGADEILGGYAKYVPFHSRTLLNSVLEQRLGWKDLRSHFLGTAATFGLSNIALWHLRAPLEPVYAGWQNRYGRSGLFRSSTSANHGYALSVPRSEPRRLPLFHRMLGDHMRDVLPSLLHYGDAVTMAHGVESRLPFLDYRLVDWVFANQPPVMQRGQTKAPVRQYLQLHGYGTIASRTDKQSYPIPLAKWLAASDLFIQVNARSLPH
jgi:asparagine synthase (glutamine-hydrolysing)